MIDTQSFRTLDLREKIRELAVKTPDWSLFRRIGDLTKLRHHPARGFYPVNYESGLLLYALVAHFRPSQILEIGTGRGFASICMAQALLDHSIEGRVVTIDPIDSTTPQNWAIDEDDGSGPRVSRFSRKEVWERHFSSELRERIESRHGTSMAILPQLERERFRADLIYIDGDHRYTGVAYDFYASMRITASPFRMLFDDYTPLSHRYGVRRLVDREIAPVFHVELIATEGGWEPPAERVPEADQAQILIDSNQVRQPLDRAFSPRRIAVRLFAYRWFKPFLAWGD